MRHISLLAFAAVSVFSSAAESQHVPFHGIEASAAGGIGFPLGIFRDFATDGPHFGLGAGYALAPGAVVGIAYDRFYNGVSDEGRELFLLGDDADVDFDTWQLVLYYKQAIRRDIVTPYIRLQAGHIDINTEAHGASVTGIDAKYSLTGGLGAEWRPGRRAGAFGEWAGIFAEFLFTRVVIDEQDPEQESDLRNFLALRAGVTAFLWRR